MATVAQGVLGPMAGWLMLLVIMVTLYDAQFPFYDTYIGRTTCDAIAVSGKARRPYRFYYFVVVTAAVLAGFYLVTVAQPFILWIGVAISAVVYRSIGAWQILLLNNRRSAGGVQGQPAQHLALVDHRGHWLWRGRRLVGDRAAARDREAVRRLKVAPPAVVVAAPPPGDPREWPGHFGFC